MSVNHNFATVVALTLAIAHPAWAADSSTVYTSGVLVLVFLGLCALIVVAQVVPLIVLLVAWAKGVVSWLTRGRLAEQRQEHQ